MGVQFGGTLERRVDVSGYKHGIEVSGSGSAGFRDVLVADVTMLGGPE